MGPRIAATLLAAALVSGCACGGSAPRSLQLCVIGLREDGAAVTPPALSVEHATPAPATYR